MVKLGRKIAPFLADIRYPTRSHIIKIPVLPHLSDVINFREHIPIL